MQKKELLNNFDKLEGNFSLKFFKINLIKGRYIKGLRKGLKILKKYYIEEEALLEGLT